MAEQKMSRQQISDRQTAGQTTAEQMTAEQMTAEPLVSEQEYTLEQAFSRLNEILTELDSGKQSLEEAFASYAQGMEMVRLCNARIDKVEKQCLVISESGEDYEL